ncbi:MAG TPA: hypothetical protein VN872_13700 [Candidatus Acidoferrum sp.]|nr:hypothetical protein [Candidatus Acidoferrum sp.]
MANTIKIFRDSITLDQSLIASLSPSAGDTLVVAARNIILSALLPDYNYTIVADQLSVSSPQFSLTGTAQNPSPQITVMAKQIRGQLVLVSKGANGTAGAAGAPGEPGVDGDPGDGGELRGPRVKPRRAGPGGPGGAGQNGGAGYPGGTIIIRYAAADQPPVASAPGGDGGPGGAGGLGGPGGIPGGKPGQHGVPGVAGPKGASVVAGITLFSANSIWQTLDAPSASAWAAYRVEVGEFNFRKFDPASQLTAIAEFQSALQLDSTNAEAQLMLTRLLQQQTPTGLSREIDIAPDYKTLSAGLLSEVGLVQGALQVFANGVNATQTADQLKNQYSGMVSQLANRQAEMADNVTLANDDILIAQQESKVLSGTMADLQKQLQDATQPKDFTFDDGVKIVTTVGEIAVAIVGFASGVGAVIAIPDSIMAFKNLGDITGGVMEILKSKQLSQDLKTLGEGLGALVKGGQSIINFEKAIQTLEDASKAPGQDKTGPLLKQLAEVAKQKMIADLRTQQAQDRLQAANRQVQDRANELVDAQNRLNSWTDNQSFLAQATESLIRIARKIIDQVAEDGFVAQRALEIYQLTPANPRFDYGYLHPDQEHTLDLGKRANAIAVSVSAFPTDVITWNDLYNRLNSAQIGFDVVHPDLSITITDPAVLDRFRQGGPLQFGIDLTDLPSDMYELKAGGISLDLVGATAAGTFSLWVEHSGVWKMLHRTDQKTVEFNLFAHREIFNCRPSTGKISAVIPENPQSPAEPGPPFSFWGRGIAATWRIYPAGNSLTTASVNLSQLTAVNLTFHCIAFAQQGAAATTARLKIAAKSAPIPSTFPLGLKAPLVARAS